MIRKPQFKLNWKYALGEIALIFIGISLAIAFQNRNDTRKEERQLNGYLKTIANNLSSDTASIMTYRNLRKMVAANGKKHMELFLKDSVSLMVFAETSSIFGESYLKLDQTGFESLKNSGYFSNLQGTKVEKSLLDYYQLYNDIHEEEASFNNFVENMEYRLYGLDNEVLRGFFAAFYNLENGSTELSQKEKQAVEKAFNNSYVIGVMQRAADMDGLFIAKYDTLAKRASRLITLIQQEVDD